MLKTSSWERSDHLTFDPKYDKIYLFFRFVKKQEHYKESNEQDRLY